MIPIKKVHELTIGSSSRDKHPDHIAAASSLVRHAGLLLVVADDELSLAIFDEDDLGDGHLMDILEGRLSPDEDERQEDKPDLESLALLPPFGQFSHGALLAVGSGSSDKRMRGSLVPLGRDGHPVDDARPVDLGELYAGLSQEVKELNIEGCAALDDTFYLAQRGNADDSEDALIALDWSSLAEDLSAGRPLSPDAVRGVKTYDLGKLHDVDLSFSDLSPIEDGRLAFSSSAEASGKDGGDGKIVGSALGILRPGGDIEYHEPVNEVVKVEGVDARLGDEGVEILIVMDADDPAHPSPLLGATIV